MFFASKLLQVEMTRLNLTLAISLHSDRENVKAS